MEVKIFNHDLWLYIIKFGFTHFGFCFHDDDLNFRYRKICFKSKVASINH